MKRLDKPRTFTNTLQNHYQTTTCITKQKHE
nr:MAG TPA: hypothetical protein [Caudoviricetes sp.]